MSDVCRDPRGLNPSVSADAEPAPLAQGSQGALLWAGCFQTASPAIRGYSPGGADSPRRGEMSAQRTERGEEDVRAADKRGVEVVRRFAPNRRGCQAGTAASFLRRVPLIRLLRRHLPPVGGKALSCGPRGAWWGTVVFGGRPCKSAPLGSDPAGRFCVLLTSR